MRPRIISAGGASSIPRSSLLGPIEHGCPPSCHAAPVEKASTAQSQTSSLTADDVYRRARLLIDDRSKGERADPDRLPEPNLVRVH